MSRCIIYIYIYIYIQCETNIGPTAVYIVLDLLRKLIRQSTLTILTLSPIDGAGC